MHGIEPGINARETCLLTSVLSNRHFNGKKRVKRQIQSARKKKKSKQEFFTQQIEHSEEKDNDIYAKTKTKHRSLEIAQHSKK